MYSDPGSGQCSYYRSTLPSYSQGSFQNMIDLMPKSNVINCDQKNNCIYNWTTQFAKNTGPDSANPCIGLNAWYDFDKRACVDTEGGTVTTTRCSSNSIYSPSLNICQAVRKPFVGQPINTINSPSLTNPGDFGKCKTANEGDCTPYYMSSNGFVTKNPCIAPSKYDFVTRSCTKLNPCCGLTPNALTSNTACGTYVNKTTTYTVIPSKCPKGSTNACCSASRQSLAACAAFWTKGTSNTYSPAYNKECVAAGFEDYDGVDSMDTQRMKWMESM
jgi:hypothetical protein